MILILETGGLGFASGPGIGFLAAAVSSIAPGAAHMAAARPAGLTICTTLSEHIKARRLRALAPLPTAKSST